MTDLMSAPGETESGDRPPAQAAPRRGMIARVRQLPAAFAVRVELWSRRRKIMTLVPLGVWVAGLIAAVVMLGVHTHSNEAVDNAWSGALAAADADVPKILSYQPDSVDQDLGSAADLLTGDFKNRFRSLVEETIVPAAKQHQTATKATVAGKSVVDGTSHSVTVLMFIDQTTTSKDAPAPRLDASRVRIHMDHVGDRWLISGLEPV
jgi:Mce-associated membrane protein